MRFLLFWVLSLRLLAHQETDLPQPLKHQLCWFAVHFFISLVAGTTQHRLSWLLWRSFAHVPPLPDRCQHRFLRCTPHFLGRWQPTTSAHFGITAIQALSSLLPHLCVSCAVRHHLALSTQLMPHSAHQLLHHVFQLTLLVIEIALNTFLIAWLQSQHPHIVLITCASLWLIPRCNCLLPCHTGSSQPSHTLLL